MNNKLLSLGAAMLTASSNLSAIIIQDISSYAAAESDGHSVYDFGGVHSSVSRDGRFSDMIFYLDPGNIDIFWQGLSLDGAFNGARGSAFLQFQSPIDLAYSLEFSFTGLLGEGGTAAFNSFLFNFPPALDSLLFDSPGLFSYQTKLTGVIPAASWDSYYNELNRSDVRIFNESFSVTGPAVAQGSWKLSMRPVPDTTPTIVLFGIALGAIFLIFQRTKQPITK